MTTQNDSSACDLIDPGRISRSTFQKVAALPRLTIGQNLLPPAQVAPWPPT
jgi:hypothetical protein